MNAVFGLLTCFYLSRFLNALINDDILNAPILILLTLLQTVLVNTIKMLRLYLLLFETNIGIGCFITMYAETGLVNLLLPYKSGEIYRGYRLGVAVSSIPVGYSAMLLDRLLDTLALISTILILQIFYDLPASPVFILFVAFCIVIISAYCLFPSLYTYLNHFLIFNKNTESTLIALHAINLCNKAYKSIGRMAKGRFFLLFLISIVAWFVEVGGMVVMRGTDGNEVISYLNNTIFGTPGLFNKLFILACILLFLLMGIFAQLTGRIRRQHCGPTHSL